MPAETTAAHQAENPGLKELITISHFFPTQPMFRVGSMNTNNNEGNDQCIPSFTDRGLIPGLKPVQQKTSEIRQQLGLKTQSCDTGDGDTMQFIGNARGAFNHEQTTVLHVMYKAQPWAVRKQASRQAFTQAMVWANFTGWEANARSIHHAHSLSSSGSTT